MNTMVATMERFESRAMPQRPWPLVHPLPRRVPNPTSTPARIAGATACSDAKASASGRTSRMATAPVISPARKTRRHGRSAAATVGMRPTVSLMPRMRPLAKNRREDATPSNSPPRMAATGVK